MQIAGHAAGGAARHNDVLHLGKPELGPKVIQHSLQVVVATEPNGLVVGHDGFVERARKAAAVCKKKRRAQWK